MASWRAPGSFLEGLGLDFGGSGPRFWRFQASIFEPPGQHAPEKLFFRKFPALSAFPPPFLPSPTAWQSSNIPATRGGGGGGPPWGVSMELHLAVGPIFFGALWASCWLIFRHLSVPVPLLASFLTFLTSLSFSERICIDL